MKLIIASNNAHKIQEIKEILSGKFSEILSLKEAGVCHETIEDGSTFLENSRKKAREISALTGCAALADDSGLCVDALDGAPGIFSARFAGEDSPALRDSANNALLLSKLSGKENRRAHFTCAMTLVYPDGRELVAEGHTYGVILQEEVGNGGFGYDPIFFSDDLQKSFGVATAEEKNAVSHRYRALQAMLQQWREAGV